MNQQKTKTQPKQSKQSTKTRKSKKIKKSKNTKKSKKLLRKKRRIRLFIGILVLFLAIMFFLLKKDYQYDWKNYGEAHITDEFLDKVVDISKELDIEPDDLMSVMAFESQFEATRVNRWSGATGLIQWMPETAVELGTTTEELRNMTAIDQLDYVYKYLKRYKGKMRTISDLYMSVLWPAAVGKEEDYILFEAGTVAYRQNDGLDVNEDGFITKQEAVQKVIKNREYYLEEANEEEESGQKN